MYSQIRNCPASPRKNSLAEIDVAAALAELAAARDDELKRLLEQMKHMSAEELQDQVHRRVEFKICPACRAPFLANPLGKPRGVRTAAN